MSTWAGFRFQNLPDDQARYAQALKDAHMVHYSIGDLVLAECKYADEENGIVGDIVPLTEILARACDLDAIRRLPAEQGRLLISVRKTDAEIAVIEDAIIKHGQYSPDQNDEGIRGQEGQGRVLRQDEQEQQVRQGDGRDGEGNP